MEHPGINRPTQVLLGGIHWQLAQVPDRKLARVAGEDMCLHLHHLAPTLLWTEGLLYYLVIDTKQECDLSQIQSAVHPFPRVKAPTSRCTQVGETRQSWDPGLHSSWQGCQKPLKSKTLLKIMK